jgi:hypothetical protein
VGVRPAPVAAAARRRNSRRLLEVDLDMDDSSLGTREGRHSNEPPHRRV